MYDPERKLYRVQLGSDQRNRKLKNWECRNHYNNILLTTIFYNKGSIHHEFMSDKQTENGKFYKEVIKRLIARVHRVRSEFQESGSWYLLLYNAPAHSSGVVSEFLVKRGIPVLSHSPYSPDLAPADVFIS
jgi:hypothetical protein